MELFEFPDSHGPPERPKRRLDQIIDAMFMVLPCSSIEEMAEKITERGLSVSYYSVAHAIKHLRRHCGEYGWSIPHVKRGIALEGEERRFFVVLTEKDGSYHLDQINKKDLSRGTSCTVLSITQQSLNSASSLEMAAVNGSRVFSERLRDWAEDYKYLARKGKRLLREMNDGDGTHGR